MYILNLIWNRSITIIFFSVQQNSSPPSSSNFVEKFGFHCSKKKKKWICRLSIFKKCLFMCVCLCVNLTISMNKSSLNIYMPFYNLCNICNEMENCTAPFSTRIFNRWSSNRHKNWMHFINSSFFFFYLFLSGRVPLKFVQQTLNKK